MHCPLSTVQAARQDHYMSTLRESYCHVRTADNNKRNEIKRLRTIINTQNISLDKCQVDYEPVIYDSRIICRQLDTPLDSIGMPPFKSCNYLWDPFDLMSTIFHLGFGTSLEVINRSINVWVSV